MKKSKKNECVELKNRIQQTLFAQYQGLSDEDREKQMSSKLAASSSPIACFWQRHSLRVADDQSDYKTGSADG